MVRHVLIGAWCNTGYDGHDRSFEGDELRRLLEGLLQGGLATL